ncbi:MAG: class I SAM-dependent methyltransferase [Actinomycetota bacterium]
MSTIEDVSVQEKAGAFLERAFGALVGASDLYLIDLGIRLGLYAALDDGAATSSELAQRSGTAERYVREWLEHHTATGILEVDDPSASFDERRYSIAPAHRDGLLNEDSLFYVGALAKCATVLAQPVEWLVRAFKTGDGIPYERYGEDAVEVQEGFTRPMFVNLLTTEWLPALADVDKRLKSDPPARVADIACGAGLAALELAKAYPKVTVDGFDSDDTSVARARKSAAEAGLEGRVNFEVRDMSDSAVQGGYDLITIFEAIHDMSRPVEVLRHAKTLLRDGGTLIVADENVGESFAEPGPVDGFFYGVSVLYCLPQALAEQPSAAIGTVIRPSTMRALARDAGFSRIEDVPIENDFWRFYRLVP